MDSRFRGNDRAVLIFLIIAQFITQPAWAIAPLRRVESLGPEGGVVGIRNSHQTPSAKGRGSGVLAFTKAEQPILNQHTYPLVAPHTKVITGIVTLCAGRLRDRSALADDDIAEARIGALLHDIGHNKLNYHHLMSFHEKVRSLEIRVMGKTFDQYKPLVEAAAAEQEVEITELEWDAIEGAFRHPELSWEVALELRNEGKITFTTTEVLRLMVLYHQNPALLPAGTPPKIVLLTQLLHIADSIEATNSAWRAQHLYGIPITLARTFKDLSKKVESGTIDQELYDLVVEMFTEEGNDELLGLIYKSRTMPGEKPPTELPVEDRRFLAELGAKGRGVGEIVEHFKRDVLPTLKGKHVEAPYRRTETTVLVDTYDNRGEVDITEAMAVRFAGGTLRDVTESSPRGRVINPSNIDLDEAITSESIIPVILMAGRGYRFDRDSTDRVPVNKCIVPINGRPVAAYLIDEWDKLRDEFNIGPVIAVVGYEQGDVMEAMGDENIYTQQLDITAGTAHALYQVFNIPQIREKNPLLVVTFGDRPGSLAGLFSSVIQQHQAAYAERQAGFTVVLTDYPDGDHISKGLPIRENDTIVAMIEKPTRDAMEPGETKMGFTANELDAITLRNYPVWAGYAEDYYDFMGNIPPDIDSYEFYLPDGFMAAQEAGRPLSYSIVPYHRRYGADITTREALAQTEAAFAAEPAAGRSAGEWEERIDKAYKDATVAVLGGTGFIGGEFLRVLCGRVGEQMKEVRALSRNHDRLQPLSSYFTDRSKLKPIEGDHLSIDEVREAIAGAKIIIDTAGRRQQPSDRNLSPHEVLVEQLMQNAMSAALIGALMDRGQRLVWASSSAIDYMLNRLDDEKREALLTEVKGRAHRYVQFARNMNAGVAADDMETIQGFIESDLERRGSIGVAEKSSYAYSKLLGETILEIIAKQDRKNILALNISDVYGYPNSLGEEVYSGRATANRMQQFLATYEAIKSEGYQPWQDGQLGFYESGDRVHQKAWNDYVCPTFVGDVVKMFLRASVAEDLEDRVDLNLITPAIGNLEMVETVRDVVGAEPFGQRIEIVTEQEKMPSPVWSEEKSDLRLLGMSAEELTPFEEGIRSQLKQWRESVAVAAASGALDRVKALMTVPAEGHEGDPYRLSVIEDNSHHKLTDSLIGLYLDEQTTDGTRADIRMELGQVPQIYYQEQQRYLLDRVAPERREAANSIFELPEEVSVENIFSALDRHAADRSDTVALEIAKDLMAKRIMETYLWHYTLSRYKDYAEEIEPEDMIRPDEDSDTLAVTITGAPGFIGATLVDMLLQDRGGLKTALLKDTGKKRIKIYTIDNFETGEPWKFLRRDYAPGARAHETIERSELEVLPLDISRSDSIAFLRRNYADAFSGVVYHAAAFVNVTESLENPALCFDANQQGSANVMNLTRMAGGKIVLISTAAVVRQPARNPDGSFKKLTEESAVDPATYYGLTKVFMERMGKLMEYEQTAPLRQTAVAYANVAGPGQMLRGEACVGPAIAKAIYEHVVEDKPFEFKIFNAGYKDLDEVDPVNLRGGTRDYVPVDLAAAAAAKAGLSEFDGEFFRISSRGEMTASEFYEKFKPHMLRALDLGSEEKKFEPILAPHRPGDPPYAVFAGTKMADELKPPFMEVNHEELFASMAEFYAWYFRQRLYIEDKSNWRRRQRSDLGVVLQAQLEAAGQTGGNITRLQELTAIVTEPAAGRSAGEVFQQTAVEVLAGLEEAYERAEEDDFDTAPAKALRNRYGMHGKLLVRQIKRYRDVARRFTNEFGPDSPMEIISAPARINIVGEHVDYVKHFTARVLPFASREYDTIMAVAPTEDGAVRLRSMQEGEVVGEYTIEEANFGVREKPEGVKEEEWEKWRKRFPQEQWIEWLDTNFPKPPHTWSNYIQGACWYYPIANRGAELRRGMNVVVDSAIPRSGGLSGSSALTVLGSYAIRLVNFDYHNIDPEELGKEAAEAEKRCGTRGGAMDQSTISNGVLNSALMIGFHPELQIDKVRMPQEGYTWITFYTSPHEGGTQLTSEYNERSAMSGVITVMLEDDGFWAGNDGLKMQWQEIVRAFARKDLGYLLRSGPRWAIEDILDLLPGTMTLDEIREAYPEAYAPIERGKEGAYAPLFEHKADEPLKIRDRARHHIYDVIRVLRVSKLLRQAAAEQDPERVENAMNEVGKLMDQAHASMRDLYGLSSDDLDEIYELLEGVQGVIGRRIMGGGFGGNLIVLAEDYAADSIIDKMTREFYPRLDKEGKAVIVAGEPDVHILKHTRVLALSL